MMVPFISWERIEELENLVRGFRLSLASRNAEIEYLEEEILKLRLELTKRQSTGRITRGTPFERLRKCSSFGDGDLARVSFTPEECSSILREVYAEQRLCRECDQYVGSDEYEIESDPPVADITPSRLRRLVEWVFWA